LLCRLLCRLPGRRTLGGTPRGCPALRRPGGRPAGLHSEPVPLQDSEVDLHKCELTGGIAALCYRPGGRPGRGGLTGRAGRCRSGDT
jgi:hypothetical protein